MPNIVATMTLCQEIAARHQIITFENMHSLKLNTYRRTIGTKVSITCLVPKLFDLVGKTLLTCLPNGQWDNPIPKCVRSNRNPGNAGVNGISGIVLPETTTTRASLVSSEESDGPTDDIKNAVPYLISVSVLAVMFFCLIVMMVYLVRLKQSIKYRQFEMKNRSPPPFVRAVESLQSIPSLSSSAYDYYRTSGSPVSGSSTRSSKQAKSTNHPDTLQSGSLHTWNDNRGERSQENFYFYKGESYRQEASNSHCTVSSHHLDTSRSSSYHTGSHHPPEIIVTDYHHTGSTHPVEQTHSDFQRSSRSFEREDDNFHSVENLEF